MAYKLQNLIMKNFGGLRGADVVFDIQPITVFAGPNNAGKSSIKDAIQFAFNGQARHTNKYNTAGELAFCGNVDDMLVHLNYLDDGELCTVKRNAKSASKGVGDFNPFIGWALNPMGFLQLKPKERGAIIVDAIGGDIQAIVKQAVAEHVGDVPKEIKAELKTSGVDMFNVDALRNAVCEIRRGFKRDIKNLCTTNPVLQDFGLPQNFDVANVDAQLKNLDGLKAELVAIVEKGQRALRLKARKKDLQKAIKQIPKVSDITDDEKRLVAEYNEKTVLAGLLQNIAKTVGTKKMGNCPLCGASAEAGNMADTCDEIHDWLKAVQPDVDAIEQKATEASKWNITLQSHKAAIAEIDNEVNNLKIAGEVLDKLGVKAGLKMPKFTGTDVAIWAEKEKAKHDKRADELRSQVDAYRRFKAAQDTYNSDVKRGADLTVLVEECDRIDGALQDGGPVKSYIAENAAQLPINNKLLKLWNMPSLKWYSDGAITLFDRPIEQASESERYRAACIMGLALAAAGDVGFAALDGFEILVGENSADAVYEAMKACKLNNVLVFVSKSIVTKATPKYMSLYNVDGGLVTPLKI